MLRLMSTPSEMQPLLIYFDSAIGRVFHFGARQPQLPTTALVTSYEDSSLFSRSTSRVCSVITKMVATSATYSLALLSRILYRRIGEELILARMLSRIASVMVEERLPTAPRTMPATIVSTHGCVHVASSLDTVACPRTIFPDRWGGWAETTDNGLLDVSEDSSKI